jgi:hypothetical protein
MSMKRRMERLEGIHQPADEPFTFHIVKPPDGLTHAQEEEWREQQHQDWGERGIPWFTLDLANCGVGLREVDP